LNPGARLHRPSQDKENPSNLLERFYDFCRVDLQLADSTAKKYRRKMRRFFAVAGKSASEIKVDDIRAYLGLFKDGNKNSYANALKPLKVFFRDFIKVGGIIESFKFPDRPMSIKVVPSKEKLRKFYYALEKPIERALFLFYATSGLRKNEVLTLQKEDIDFKKRMIIPRSNQTRTKRRWVSFFSEEAEKILQEYLSTRKGEKGKLFRIGTHTFLSFWKRAQLKTQVHITPKILRKWFCTEMGRLGVPDRFVDAFCGRVPKSVLARHYTDYSPEKLKEIYDKAGLKVQD